MDAFVLFGCFGFSSNSTIRSVSSVFMIPNRLASSNVTSNTAIVQSAFFALCAASILL